MRKKNGEPCGLPVLARSSRVQREGEGLRIGAGRGRGRTRTRRRSRAARRTGVGVVALRAADAGAARNVVAKVQEQIGEDAVSQGLAIAARVGDDRRAAGPGVLSREAQGRHLLNHQVPIVVDQHAVDRLEVAVGGAGGQLGARRGVTRHPQRGDFLALAVGHRDIASGHIGQADAAEVGHAGADRHIGLRAGNAGQSQQGCCGGGGRSDHQSTHLRLREWVVKRDSRLSLPMSGLAANRHNLAI
uniref:LigA n=1 Tax=Parastrongyloides trichosuri TaxID=131310 RepID=A0A0N4ZAP0_PARTI